MNRFASRLSFCSAPATFGALQNGERFKFVHSPEDRTLDGCVAVKLNSRVAVFAQSGERVNGVGESVPVVIIKVVE